jgi:hypothetical protein
MTEIERALAQINGSNLSNYIFYLKWAAERPDPQAYILSEEQIKAAHVD